MRIQKPLHRLDILFVFEPRKYFQVIKRLRQVPDILQLACFIPIPSHQLPSLISSVWVLNILRLLIFLPSSSLILQNLVDNKPGFG